MNIQTCQFVSATDVFKGCGLAWDVFAGGDPDCSWGDNNRTMVTPDVIIRVLEQDEHEGSTKRQVTIALKRLEQLGQTYVDLES